MPNPDFNRLKKVLLRLGEPDRIPFFEILADEEILQKATGVDSYPENAVEFFYRFGYDHVPMGMRIPYQLPVIKTADTAELAREKREFYDENMGVINNRGDFESYRWPEINTGLLENIIKTISILPGGMKVTPRFRGVFEILSYLMGLVPLSYSLYDDPRLVEDIIEKLGNDMLALIKLSIRELDPGKTGAFILCEDMGYITGTMMDPEFLRKYIFPWEKKAVDLIHDHDFPAILHSCGNLSAVMDDLIDYVGFDAKHSFEDKTLPVAEAKKKYGDRIAILGGVDMNALSTFEEGDLRSYVRGILENCAPGGGYALGAGNSLANCVPLKNIRIMLDEGGKYR